MARSAAGPRFFVEEGDPPSKQGILRAALKLFVRNGLAATNVRMIGHEAGYTNPAMFKFFDSKDALAAYLFERCYLWLARSVAAAVAGRPFEEARRSLVAALVALMEEDLEAVLFVQDALRELWPSMPDRVRRRSVIRLLRELLERGAREGAVVGYPSSDVPVAAVLGVFAQLGRMLYFGEVKGRPSDHRADLDLAVARVLKG